LIKKYIHTYQETISGFDENNDQELIDDRLFIIYIEDIDESNEENEERMTVNYHQTKPDIDEKENSSCLRHAHTLDIRFVEEQSAKMTVPDFS